MDNQEEKPETYFTGEVPTERQFGLKLEVHDSLENLPPLKPEDRTLRMTRQQHDALQKLVGENPYFQGDIGKAINHYMVTGILELGKGVLSDEVYSELQKSAQDLEFKPGEAAEKMLKDMRRENQ